MAVGQDPLPEVGVAELAAPGLRVADEEPLVAGQSADDGRRLAMQRQLPGVIGGGQAGDVGDVLAQRLGPVHVHVRERAIGVELGRQLRRRGLEVIEVLGRPPVQELAGRVELAALVVEAVAHLVADGGSHGAVIHRRVRLGVEPRGLHVGGGEVEGVLDRQVHRIDRLRRHPPLRPVDRPAELGKAAIELMPLAQVDIQQGVVGRDLQVRIVAPAVGIADLDVQRRQLGLGGGFGGRGHPRQPVDPAAEGGADVARHGFHLGPDPGREVTLHVKPADRVAERVVDRIDSPFPPEGLFRGSTQGLAVEGEVLVRKGLGHDVRKGV